MSALLLPALAAGSSGQGALYVDDVFSTYLRTGTGADTTVTTGIDMTKGYMLWSKGRSGATEHAVYDSARGVTLDLVTNSIAAQTTQATGLKAVSSTGHTIGSLAKMNTSGATYVDWVFRKAPKFFDVVTYTGNGIAGRQISHSLGVAPGMIVVKRLDIGDSWGVWHRSLALLTNELYLNGTGAVFDVSPSSLSLTSGVAPSSSLLTLGNNNRHNASGGSYVAYLFAHDPSAEGIIQCGSFTTDASGNATVNLGWEPQYLIVKQSSTSDNWTIFDSARDMSLSDSRLLYANTNGVEIVNGVSAIRVSAVGFTAALAANRTYIYLAIRRPNKPPTTGTQVYGTYAKPSGETTNVINLSFSPDAMIAKNRSGGTASGAYWFDRLRGMANPSPFLISSATNAETTQAGKQFGQNSESPNRVNVEPGANTNLQYNDITNSSIFWFFRRAKGFFDIVCDTGTGAAHAITHGLGVIPNLGIRKSRSGATQWEVFCTELAANEKLVLNSTAAKVTDATAWNSTLPTSTQFTVGTGANVNTNAATYVTYLFATLAGISKVGSYTGNGTSQTINCGFATGARFILIKRTDATGDWYVWDSVRGIIAANDPHLSLNTADAEVTTDDSVDPEASGFIVNQNTATNINVNGGQYIFLAIA